MEGIGKPAVQTQEKARQAREGIRNQIFDQLVAGHVLETFHDDIVEADISEEAYGEISATFAQLSEENKRAVLAIPAALRTKTFAKYAKRLQTGELDGTGVVLDILDVSKRNGFTIGFHLSPYDVKHDKDGDWKIRGTEKDHRHNDLPMAYYSLDYAHRYLKKPAQFLYVIRAGRKERSLQRQ